MRGPCSLAPAPAASLAPLSQRQVVMLTSLRALRAGAAAPCGFVGRALPQAQCGAAAALGATYRVDSAAAGRRVPPARAYCLATQHLRAEAGSTPLPAASLPLPPGEVHVWWLDPTKVAPDAPLLARCEQLLAPEELQECKRSPDAAVRRERLLARALVRSVLARYLPPAPHPGALLFNRNTHGKPDLLWPAHTQDGHRLRFNLTHTSSMIGLALSAGGLVGLDVEECERRTRADPMRLARRRFSDAEVAELEACSDQAARAAYFLQLWTLKESYVKALGRGTSAPPGLRSFSFRVAPPAPVPVHSQHPPEQPQHFNQQRQAGQLQLQQQLGSAGAAGWETAEDSSSSSSSSAQSSSSWGNRPTHLAQHHTLHQRDSGSSSSSSGSVLQAGGLHLDGDSSSFAPEASSSSSSSSRHRIHFSSVAPDPRRWQFALLQPSPQHVAALCLEEQGTGGEVLDSPRLLCFEAEQLGEQWAPSDARLLAHGCFPAA